MYKSQTKQKQQRKAKTNKKQETDLNENQTFSANFLRQRITYSRIIRF